MSLKEESWVRAGVSVAANLFRGGISFLTGMLVARVLGAKEYGELTFLLGSFNALALMLDFGSTSAFYTMLSARQRGPRFFIVYVLWTVGIQFVATFLVVALVLPPTAVNKIWLGVGRQLVLLSLASSFFVTQIWTTILQLAEASRKTVVIQGIASVQVVAHLSLIVAAIYFHQLTLTLLLALPIIEYGLLAFVLAPSLFRSNRGPGPDRETFGRVIGEYWSYCKPLVAYSTVGFLSTFADAWLLQRFAGSIQQGYFGVGVQFATVANVVTASILAVLWKEVSESHERNDLKRVRSIFESVRRGVFFFGAAVAAIFLPYVGLLLRTTVGIGYSAATLCVTLMFLYPIHQAIGQFQGTFLLATHSTVAYSIIGITNMIASIPLTYFLLATPSGAVPGLGWGAVGLAAKKVILQIAGVTAQFWVLRRQHGFQWQWRFEIVSLVALVGLSFGIRSVVRIVASAFVLSPNEVVIAGAATVLFTLAVSAIVARNPALLGITALQRDAIIRIARRFVARPV